MKVISLYFNFKNTGGAQNIALLLAEKLNDNIPVILTRTPAGIINKEYRARKIQFELFNVKNILRHRTDQAVYLSHDRKLTAILVLLNRFLIKKLCVVHVAHNVFTNLKLFTLYPETIIVVSNGVKQNLVNYFGIAPNRIRVIFNGMEDIPGLPRMSLSTDNSRKIRIILPGRLCRVKQQVEMVVNTKGLFRDNIEFYFAGEGETLSELKAAIGSSVQYKILGYIDIRKEMANYDYVCLFSQKEGMPVSLIEGCMFGKPLITNNIESVLDVNRHGYNGFVVSGWKELADCVNNLPAPDSDEYRRLSANARTRYLECFTLDRMVGEYKKFFLNLNLQKRLMLGI